MGKLFPSLTLLVSHCIKILFFPLFKRVNLVPFCFTPFVVFISLFGTFTKVHAQSSANCYGPYNPTPASVWGIAEKFASNAVIWNGGTPTAADLNGDGITELLVPASDYSGYYTYA